MDARKILKIFATPKEDDFQGVEQGVKLLGLFKFMSDFELRLTDTYLLPDCEDMLDVVKNAGRMFLTSNILSVRKLKDLDVELPRPTYKVDRKVTGYAEIPKLRIGFEFRRGERVWDKAEFDKTYAKYLPFIKHKGSTFSVTTTIEDGDHYVTHYSRLGAGKPDDTETRIMEELLKRQPMFLDTGCMEFLSPMNKAEFAKAVGIPRTTLRHRADKIFLCVCGSVFRLSDLFNQNQ